MKINLVKCLSIRDSNGMSLSSRYSNFNEGDKTKFADCAKIINSNVLDLKKNLITKL